MKENQCNNNKNNKNQTLIGNFQVFFLLIHCFHCYYYYYFHFRPTNVKQRPSGAAAAATLPAKVDAQPKQALPSTTTNKAGAMAIKLVDDDEESSDDPPPPPSTITDPARLAQVCIF